MILIVDIDGTLFDNTQRCETLLPAMSDISNTHAWSAFNKACKDDKPNLFIINQVKQLMATSIFNKLIFLTSRGESSRQETLAQLRTQFGDHTITLIMRDMDDGSSPVAYKRDSLYQLSSSNIFVNQGPIILFDDNNEIINMVQSDFPYIITVHVPSTCIAYKLR